MSFIFDFEYYDEKTDKVYSVDVLMKNTHEKNYGSDIDGNRGTPADFVEIEEIIVYDDGQRVNSAELEKRVEKFFETKHYPTACELCADDFHNEDDYDDLD